MNINKLIPTELFWNQWYLKSPQDQGECFPGKVELCSCSHQAEFHNSPLSSCCLYFLREVREELNIQRNISFASFELQRFLPHFLFTLNFADLSCLVWLLVLGFDFWFTLVWVFVFCFWSLVLLDCCSWSFKGLKLLSVFEHCFYCNANLHLH